MWFKEDDNCSVDQDIIFLGAHREEPISEELLIEYLFIFVGPHTKWAILIARLDYLTPNREKIDELASFGKSFCGQNKVMEILAFCWINIVLEVCYY